MTTERNECLQCQTTLQLAVGIGYYCPNKDCDYDKKEAANLMATWQPPASSDAVKVSRDVLLGGDAGSWEEQIEQGAAYITAHTARVTAAKDAEIARLREVLEFYGPSGDWGKWLAWIVNGAPTHGQGVDAAKSIAKHQLKVEAALATPAAQTVGEVVHE